MTGNENMFSTFLLSHNLKWPRCRSLFWISCLSHFFLIPYDDDMYYYYLTIEGFKLIKRSTSDDSINTIGIGRGPYAKLVRLGDISCVS